MEITGKIFRQSIYQLIDFLDACLYKGIPWINSLNSLNVVELFSPSFVIW